MKKITIDDVLAQEAYRLSMNEREEILDDLHGIAITENEESAEFISRALTSLDDEIDQIPIKVAYEKALSLSPDYVRDPKLRLKFLRADTFDPKSAAKRLVSFFEAKMELFGPEKVGQVIKLKDLSADDRVVLESGIIQALPGRDNAGRAVFFQYLELQRFPNVENHLLRSLYYVIMALAESVETQIKGMVSIPYICFGAEGKAGQLYLWRMAKLRICMPLRIAAVHVCKEDETGTDLTALLFGFFSFFYSALPKEIRTRIRLHVGSHMECRYALFSFGIRSDSFPITANGELQREQFLEWLRARQASEEAAELCAVIKPEMANCPHQVPRLVDFVSSWPIEDPRQCIHHLEVQETSKGALSPAPSDVLFGRGKLVKDNPGNIFLHRLAEERMSRYEKTSKWEKTVIAAEIIAIIQEKHGRFLKMEHGSWVQVHGEAAREKVSHAFRSRRRIIAASTVG